MDEIPVTFDMLFNRTVNKICEKSILVKTTGHEERQIYCIVSCMADETKLKPMIFLGRKPCQRKCCQLVCLFKYILMVGWIKKGAKSG